MPYQFQWEPKGIYKRFYGHVTAPEFMASITAFHDDPRFDLATYSLNDFTDVESTNISEKDIQLFAAQGAGAFFTNPRIKIAIITTQPGFRQMVETYLGLGIVNYPLSFYTTLEEARQAVKAG